MNYELCDNYYYIDQKALKTAPRFQTCPNCNGLLVLVPNKTNLKVLLETKTNFHFLDDPSD